MSTLIIEKQNSNIVPSAYGSLGPFASQKKAKSLCGNEFGHILSFLGPKDLARSEKVCLNWNRFINSTGQWKQQCKIQLGVSTNDELEKFRPKSLSYKGGVKLLVSSIIDDDVYKFYIGKVGPVPRIPEAISLSQWNVPDPCDPTKTIGTEYFWMYRPSHIEISVPENSPLYLNGPDDITKSDAPRLMERTPEKTEGLVIGLAKGAIPKIKLKVPVTINNIEELFKRPKTGNPSKYKSISNKIVEQHGNKRIEAGWTCIKKAVIGLDLPYVQQLELANKKGVVPSDLVTRILANCWGHIRSGKAKIYLDGQYPYTFARTSTLIRDSRDKNWSSGCGDGGPSGLSIICRSLDNAFVGMGVELSAKV